MENFTAGIGFNAALIVGSLLVVHKTTSTFNNLIAFNLSTFGVPQVYVQLFTIAARWDVLALVISCLYQNQTDLALTLTIESMICSIFGTWALNLSVLSAGDRVMFHPGMTVYTTMLASLLQPLFTGYLYFPGKVVGFLSLLSFSGVVYAVHCMTAKAGYSNPFETVQRRKTTNRLEKSLTGLEKVVEGEKTEMQAEKVEEKASNAMALQIIGILIAIGVLGLASYAILTSALNISTKFDMTSATPTAILTALLLNIPEVVNVCKQRRINVGGEMIAKTVGGNLFMITLCAGLIFWFGDSDELDTRSVLLTILESATLHIGSILLLVVTLADGRRWMGWILGGLYAVFLVVALAWIR